MFDDFNLDSLNFSSDVPTYEPVNFGKGKSNPKSGSQKTKSRNYKSNNDKSREEDDSESTNEPIKPRTLVRPIMSGQFEPFSHFFITATKVQNLNNCQNRSLFLKFRVHPTIPIIESPAVWCSNRDAFFNCSYSLDFTKMPPFNLGDFTPVIELYRRYNSSNELIAVTLLPLKVKEVVECLGHTLTYLYRETPIILRDLTTGEPIGTILTSVAFGFIEHEKMLDPNIKNLITPNYTTASSNNDNTNIMNGKSKIMNQTNDQEIVKPNFLPVQIENIQNYQQVPTKNVKKSSPKRRERQSKYSSSRHHSRHHSDRDDYNWVDEAIRLGWKPPGTVEVDWKAKARSRGWVPPNEALKSDIGVIADYSANNREFFKVISNQTEPEITGLPPPPSLLKQKPIIPNNNGGSSSSFVSSSNGDAFEDLDLFELLNPKLKKEKYNKESQSQNDQNDKKSKKNAKKNNQKDPNDLLIISEPQSFSDSFQYQSPARKAPKPVLKHVKCVTLFDAEPINQSEILDSDDSFSDTANDGDNEMLSKINKYMNLANPQKNNLASFKLSTSSSDDDNNKEEENYEIKKNQKNIKNDPKNIIQNIIDSVDDSSFDEKSNSSSNSIAPLDIEEINNSVNSLYISDTDDDDNNNENKGNFLNKKSDSSDIDSDSDSSDIVGRLNMYDPQTMKYLEVLNGI